MNSHLRIIQKFIPSTIEIVPIPTEDTDFWPGHYFHYAINRSDPPHRQEVCLYIDSQPIHDPLFDGSEVSPLEGLEAATGKVALGYFTAGGLLVTTSDSAPADSPSIPIDSTYNDRFACLYLLR